VDTEKTAMLEVAHAQVGGVRAFWVEAPGPLAAGLVFGVGQSHEALTTRGVTHLVEHLALHGIGEQHVAFNGTADLLATSFLVRGTVTEAGEFLSGVARSLAALPLERLSREVRILDTEAAGRGDGGPLGMLLDLRYGASAHGLCNYDELGLKRVDPATVERWRDRYFVDGNAVLWFAGPRPPDIELDIPRGPAQPLPPAPPLGHPLPAWSGYRPNVVAAGFLGPRSAAFSVGLQVLEQRLRHRLRHDEGRSYGVSGSMEALGPDTGHGVLVADCLPEEAEAVRDGMLAELGRLALTGPTAEELAKLASQAARAWADPEASAALASWTAREALLGRPIRRRAEVVAEMEAVEPPAVASAMSDAFESALWLVPGHLGMDDRRITEWSGWSPRRPSGRSYVRAGAPDAPERLVVGGDAVSLVVEPERQITVGFSDCAAVLSWDDGARTVLGLSGMQVHIHPEAWVDGRRAVAAVDDWVPRSMVVPMGREAGAPAPPRPPEPVAAPPPPPRAARVRRRRGPGLWIVMVVCGLMALGGIGGYVDPEPGQEADRVASLVVGILFAGGAAFGAYGLFRRRDW
jgi:zinc protease